MAILRHVFDILQFRVTFYHMCFTGCSKKYSFYEVCACVPQLVILRRVFDWCFSTTSERKTQKNAQPHATFARARPQHRFSFILMSEPLHAYACFGEKWGAVRHARSCIILFRIFLEGPGLEVEAYFLFSCSDRVGEKGLEKATKWIKHKGIGPWIWSP